MVAALGMQLAYPVATAMPDQRLAAPVRVGHDLADEQHVVACGMQRVVCGREKRLASSI